MTQPTPKSPGATAPAAPLSTTRNWAPLTGREHVLKTDHLVFEEVMQDRKRFEIRRGHDRDFAEGDSLLLRETQHTGAEMAGGAPLAYTGREVARRVVGIMRGPCYGLIDGWVLLSIAPYDAAGPEEVTEAATALAVAYGALMSSKRQYGEVGTRDSYITRHNESIDRAANALKPLLDQASARPLRPAPRRGFTSGDGTKFSAEAVAGIRAAALQEAALVCHNRAMAVGYASNAGREAAHCHLLIRDQIAPKPSEPREHVPLTSEMVTLRGAVYMVRLRGDRLLSVDRLGRPRGAPKADDSDSPGRDSARYTVAPEGTLGMKVASKARQAIRERLKAEQQAAQAAQATPASAVG